MLEIAVRRRQGAVDLDIGFATDGAGVTALFGRSGAGKTSLVNMMAGLARPDWGRIKVDGRVLFDSERGIDLKPEARRIGYVFQEGRLFPHLTVRGNLAYGQRGGGAKSRRALFDQVVGLLGIAPLLDRRPGLLSGGEKQRVAIGRALLSEPGLLLMDEPLAALDAARKAEVLPFIGRLQRELSIPILYVSHAIEEILRLADAMVLLDGGRSVAVGSVEEIMSRLDLMPLTGRYEAGAVLSLTVDRHDDVFGLTHLRLPGGVLKVGRLDAAPGTPVRVRIHAKDVAVALEPPRNISVQNIIKGEVAEISEAEDASVDVRLDIGCPLWARMTRRAVADLALEPGRTVFALVKTVSMARASLAARDGFAIGRGPGGAGALEENLEKIEKTRDR